MSLPVAPSLSSLNSNDSLALAPAGMNTARSEFSRSSIPEINQPRVAAIRVSNVPRRIQLLSIRNQNHAGYITALFVGINPLDLSIATPNQNLLDNA